jgi:hypothetical protein
MVISWLISFIVLRLENGDGPDEGGKTWDNTTAERRTILGFA